MKASAKNSKANTNGHSKIDRSGTDPNRYGGYYSSHEAEKLGEKFSNNNTPSLIPGVEANVSALERMLMVAAGSFWLYRSLTGKHKSIPQSLVAGSLLMRGISGYCPVYDVTKDKGGTLKSKNINIRTTIVIDKPVNEVYEFWRKLENLPLFMKHLESVKQLDTVTSEWKATGPAGIGSISWTAQILMDEKNKMLSWQSMPDSTVDNAGKVKFKSLGGKTELDVTISYRAPLGMAGEVAASWINPLFERMVRNDIESFKSYMEAGQSASLN